MSRDVIRDQVLLFPSLFGRAAKLAGELVVALKARLFHQLQHIFRDMLGRDRELPADVVRGQLFDVLGRARGQVVAHARGDEHLADAGLFAHAPHQLDDRPVIGDQVLADVGMHAREATTLGLKLVVLAAHLVHICRRSAQVRDDAPEVVHSPQRPQLP